jgi:hypothetical protein
MSILKRTILAATMSWSFSLTLGILFAISSSGHIFLKILLVPEVILIALTVSSVISICLMPIAFWTVRTGVKNLSIYAPLFWIALAVYEVMVVPKYGNFGLYGLLAFSVIGLFILGFIPTAKASGPGLTNQK